MKKLYFATVLAFLINLSTKAQINLTTPGGSYSENFDGMGATGTTLPSGWNTIRYAGTGTANQVLTPTLTEGTASSGAIYNVGAAGSDERALGTLASGSTVPAFGASFTNNTGSVISNFTLSGFSEQWRTGSNAQNEVILFEYSTDATSLSTGTWTPVSSLNLLEILTATTSSGAVDGNTNRVAISGNLSSINLANGSTIWIRWRDNDNTGTDGMYALDDFQMSWTNVAVASTVSVTAGTNAAEPSTNGSFNITLNTPAPAGGVTINYTLSGTATIGTDYINAQNGTITVPQGSTTATIAITVVDDNVSEPAETIIATINNASNGYSVATSSATINLADNESSTLYSFNFSACTGALSDGFTQQSVTGNAQVWACTNFGRSDNAVQMNGFASTAQANEDWLISPPLDLSGTNFPLLSFYSRSEFKGPSLQLYITTNYTGNIATTSWTGLNGMFPTPGSNVWTLSENINLGAYKQADVRIAFKYVSLAIEDSASRWTVDDITILNSAVAPPPTLTIDNTIVDFRQLAPGDLSIGKTFTFTPNNLTSNLTITAPNNFLLSKNNLTYSKTITYTVAELGTSEKRVYVGFNPTAQNAIYSGLLSFTSTGINQQTILVKGNTYPAAATLNVVNWNLEWFGGALGPANNDVQEQNVKTVMDQINADVYALVEIVDTARLGRLVRSLDGGYAYVVSDYSSLASSPADPDYATGQKLALVYKTSVVSNVSARGLMKSSASANSSWASGRVPFLVNTRVMKNGTAKNISFIVVHGKAEASQSDHESRLAGATELKDTLNTYFSNRNIIILGDFNDDLDRSIYTGATLSSYDPIIKDSTDGDSYESLTLLFSQFGLNSTADFPDVIDHVVVSNEIALSYLPLSASLFNDVEMITGITDYAGTTSDHYPVLTRYLFEGASEAPLPVKLIEFSAAKQNTAVKLNWATSQEINSKEFVVERSANSVNFETIATVAARGNSSTTTFYQATDVRPVQGNNFYRLRSVDLDGKTELSKILKINFAKAFTVSLTPNPASQYLVVNLTNRQEPITMQLIDASGRLVQQTILLNDVNRISLHNVNKGVYFVKLIATSESYTEKLIVE
jgi:endonuclease/exonuclease/phosphatase family metal-dependent hydrolase